MDVYRYQGDQRERQSLELAEIRALLFSHPKEGEYTDPSEYEKKVLQYLCTRLQSPDRPAAKELNAIAGSAELAVHEISFAGQAYTIIKESAAPRGAGAYIFRDDVASPPLLLQAPHSFFDARTGIIALHMFFSDPDEVAPQALFVNTMHRYREAASTDTGVIRTDVCKNPNNLFTAATSNIVERFPATGRVVQLHGYTKNRWPESEVADIILSAGTTEPPHYIDSIAEAIRSQLSLEVKIYPRDTRIMGATKNVQGQVVRKTGRQFVHIEVSREVRKQFSKDLHLFQTMRSILYTA